MPPSLDETPAVAAPVLTLVGASAWARRVRRDLLHVAPHPASVLITGPSGTGKELIARAIHALSPRAEGAFIPVDCAAIAGTLFASHMFGHVRGAFTGATHEALGCFRAADGGTIFLDEIGELEPDLQAKLLRTLQERAVVPVGSYQPVPVSVRVIAATNRPLEEDVASGRFREDLYYRLNVVSLRTLPLSERPEDIAVLARHFLARLAARDGLLLKRLSPEALLRMRSYAWPGNVRELENALERAVVYTPGEVIRPEALPGADGEYVVPRAAEDNHLAAGHPGPEAHLPDGPPDGHGGHWPKLADVERDHIRRTLERTSHNQTAAARLLGIDRHRLRRKVRKLGLDVSDSKPGRPRKGSA